jgi:hypothetical protein
MPASCDPCCLTCPRWRLTLGAWIWGVEGDIGGPNGEVSVDSDWTDTLEVLDSVEFAFDARLRYEVKKWRFQVGVDGSTLEDSIELENGTVGGEVKLWTAYATVGYVIAGGRTDCTPCAGTWCLDAYAGARYWDVSLDGTGTVGGPGGLDLDDQWLDPIVGLHFAVTWAKWSFMAEADIGGFGVGSDFTWSAQAAVGYHFNRTWGIHMGWKHLDVDRDESDFTFDAALSGPFVALSIQF